MAHMGEDKRLTMAEDALKSFWICALSKKSVGISDKLYFYCENDTSITRKIDRQTRDKRISDISRVIDELDSLRNVPELRANPAFDLCQKRTMDNLKSVVALEYRYDGLLSDEGGANVILAYLKACAKSLRYHRKWQTYMRMALVILTFGKVKL